MRAAATVAVVAVALAQGGVCSSESAPKFSGGGIDLTCNTQRGISFEISADVAGSESPEGALDGLQALLDDSDSNLTLPEGTFVGTGLSSGSEAVFSLTDDKKALATVQLVNRGKGWLVTGVKICS